MSDKNWSLIIDTATPLTQVGVLSNGTWLSYYSSGTSPLEALFEGINTCLTAMHTKMPDLSAIIYCEGPGSVLGGRITTMALTTWRQLHPAIKLFSYNSLEACKRITKKEATYVAPGRQGYWHTLCKRQQEVNSGELNELIGEIYFLPSKKRSQALPENAIEVDYNLKPNASIFEKQDWLTPQEKPKLFIQKDPHYTHWSGNRHR